MKPVIEPPDGPDTRGRLLAAAETVFAAEGFHHATIRSICTLANANIAAVNYHFRDKDGLYAAVLQNVFERARARAPLPPKDAGSPEARLGAFIRAMLTRMLGDSDDTHPEALIAREMIEPSAALDIIVDRMMRPVWNELRGIVREISGETDDREVDLLAMSVIGQLVAYKHCRAVVERLAGRTDFTPAGLSRLADHITRFSLAALRSRRRTARPAPRRAAGK